MPRELSKKRKRDILKDREAFEYRLLAGKWKNDETADWPVRLALLMTIEPNQTARQNLNRAKLLLRG